MGRIKVGVEIRRFPLTLTLSHQGRGIIILSFLEKVGWIKKRIHQFYSASIPKIDDGSPIPQSMGYKPSLRAFWNELCGQSAGF
jgi:hypothetical protein